MTGYSIPALDLSGTDELAWLAQLLADMRRAAPTIRPLIVGALARDIHLYHAFRIPIERRTTDTDFAIAVSDWSTFNTIRESLLASGLFESRRGPVHQLQHREFGRVDLIPFGPVERQDGSIEWPPAGDEVMSVLAYTEAMDAAITVFLPSTQSGLVVSLPILAILKLLAWKDRRLRKPRADAADLSLVLRNYLNAGNEKRFSEQYHNLLTAAFDFETVGAWLLGRDARDSLRLHSKRFDHLIQVLTETIEPELDLDGQLTLATQLSGRDVEAAYRLLAAFHRGLIGGNA